MTALPVNGFVIPRFLTEICLTKSLLVLTGFLRREQDVLDSGSVASSSLKRSLSSGFNF